MNGKGARGMPSVDLSIQSQERIVQEATPIPESEMFKKKGEQASNNPSAVSMEVKEIEKKPKKKLTEKQLEALKRGREKSMETRKAKAQKKKETDKEWAERREAEEKRNAPPPPPVVKEETSFVDNRQQQYHTPMPQMPQAPSMGNFSIDYDKIIHGVSTQLDSRRLAREQKEHEVADNIAKYEEQIREDERNKLYAEMDAEEEEEKQRKSKATTQKVLQTHRPVDYGYAFQGGRSRYRRY